MGWLPRSKGRIRREAADWKIRLESGVDGQEAAAFRRWRDSDPKNGEAFDRLSAIWAAAKDLPSGPGVEPFAASRPRIQRSDGLALAASLVAALGLLAILAVQQGLIGSRSAAPQLLAFATPVGEIRQAALPDGSRLTLDASSRVEGRMSAAERRLTLVTGRARFAVAPGTPPLLVRVASTEIVASGTMFDINLVGDRPTILVIKGAALIEGQDSQPSGPITLRAGQKLAVEKNGRPSRYRPGELGWPQRMLEFDSTTLSEAAAMMNRYSLTRIEIDDRQVAMLRVSGAYRAGDTAAFARSLAAMFGLRLERQSGDRIRLAWPVAGPDRSSARREMPAD